MYGLGLLAMEVDWIPTPELEKPRRLVEGFRFRVEDSGVQPPSSERGTKNRDCFCSLFKGNSKKLLSLLDALEE